VKAVKVNEEVTNNLYCSNEVIELDPKLIKIGWRARKDYGDVSGLAVSIATVGQLQPVVVKQNKKGQYVIIAGLRRTRACRRLKINVKAVVVSPENEWHMLSMQLAENVKRKDFDKLEVGEGLQRLKIVYEKANPEAKVGKSGGPHKITKDAVAAKFVTGAAEALNISERSVYELLKIADLPEEDKEEIDSAKTTRERNINARKALGKVRKIEKEKRLKRLAAKKKEEAKKQRAKKESAEKETTPQDEEPEVDEVEENEDTRESIVINIHAGDCMHIMGDYEPIMDLVFTDPPYGRRRSTIQRNESVSINETISWDVLDLGWVELAAQTLNEGGSLISFCPLEAIGDYERAIVKAGLEYKTAIVWHKTNPGTAYRNTYLSSCEALVWAVKGKEYYLDLPDDDKQNYVTGPICCGEERLDHATQKPLWLIQYILERHGFEGCNVLDPFCGVGTTLVGCKKLGMNGYGIEMEEAYIEKAKLRIDAI
jgi:ParB/RepB/Spo0J family partition protein